MLVCTTKSTVWHPDSSEDNELSQRKIQNCSKAMPKVAKGGGISILVRDEGLQAMSKEPGSVEFP